MGTIGFTSSLTTNLLTGAGISVTETTSLQTDNSSPGPTVALGTILDTATFTTSNQTQTATLDVPTGAGPYSLTQKFVIHTNGVGTANLTVTLNVVDATCPSTFDFDFSGTQYADCFRDVHQGGLINAKPGIVPSDHPALVFTGQTGSGGATWLTVYDATPGTSTPGPTFGEKRCAPTCSSRASTTSRVRAWSRC